MNRRNFLKAVGALSVSGLAGCTWSSQNGTDNNASVQATSSIEDGILQINGETGYDCHSGHTDKIAVDVRVVVDDVVEDTLHTVVDTRSCGGWYAFSLTYNLDNIEGDWETIEVRPDVVERR